MPQEMQRPTKEEGRCIRINRRGEILLAQLLAFFVRHHGDVTVARRRESKQFLEVDLAWGGLEEVRPADDVCNAVGAQDGEVIPIEANSLTRAPGASASFG